MSHNAYYPNILCYSFRSTDKWSKDEIIVVRFFAFILFNTEEVIMPYVYCVEFMRFFSYNAHILFPYLYLDIYIYLDICISM